MKEDVAQAKRAIVRVLDELLPEQIAEVLDFTFFLRARKHPDTFSHIHMRSVPATSLIALTGLVSLGGDSVVDTEALYDSNGSRS